MPATSTRFEPLPAFTPLKFSLTDGTDIPPPPDSPIEEQAPPPPSKPSPAPIAVQVQLPLNTSVNNENGAQRSHPSTTDVPPQSPATSMRPSSIRRFLSRRSLNANYMNGTNHNTSSEDLSRVERPDSPSSFFGERGLKAKKSGSWFRKLGSNNRSSLVLENLPEEKKVVPMGPPPPKLPELNQFKASVPDNDEGSLGGGDMFKNIK